MDEKVKDAAAGQDDAEDLIARSPSRAVCVAT